jgi:hypothetical protein
MVARDAATAVWAPLCIVDLPFFRMYMRFFSTAHRSAGGRTAQRSMHARCTHKPCRHVHDAHSTLLQHTLALCWLGMGTTTKGRSQHRARALVRLDAAARPCDGGATPRPVTSPALRMGCVASLPRSAFAFVSGTRSAPPAPDAADGAAVGAPMDDAEDGVAEVSAELHDATLAAPAASAPQAALPQASGEKLSPSALCRLRDSFVAGASPGSVYDTYSLGETLGACVRAARVRVHLVACSFVRPRVLTVRAPWACTCARRAHRHRRLRRRRGGRAPRQPARGGGEDHARASRQRAAPPAGAPRDMQYRGHATFVARSNARARHATRTRRAVQPLHPLTCACVRACPR